MGLMLLLTLAVLAQPSPAPVAPGGSRPNARPAPSLDVEPLQLEAPVLRLRPLLPRASGSGSITGASAGPGETQLRNRRTGVTCTLRIVRVPALDAGILFTVPGAVEPHPSVRNDLSPCSE